MGKSTYRYTIIAMFAVEAFPFPVVGMGWVFALCAPGMLFQPTLEVAFLWTFLVYPVVYLAALLAAVNANDPKSRLQLVYAAVPAFVLLAHVAALLRSGVLA